MIREHLSTDCHYLNVICWSSSKSPIKPWKCLSWFDSGEHSKQSWIMHAQFFVSQTKYFIKSQSVSFVFSALSQSVSFVFSALMSSLIFWWMAQTHTDTRTHIHYEYLMLQLICTILATKHRRLRILCFYQNWIFWIKQRVLLNCIVCLFWTYCLFTILTKYFFAGSCRG